MASFRRASITLALAAVSLGALATLGRAPNTPERTPPQAGPRQAVPADNLYTVHQTVLPTGTVVTEFASLRGQVFALKWQGPVLPDLSQFFGDYFPAFQAAARQRHASGARGGALLVQQRNLVVLSRGRMGRFEGHAYAPELVPAGVTVGDLLQ
jgi:hypothetical protein